MVAGDFYKVEEAGECVRLSIGQGRFWADLVLEANEVDSMIQALRDAQEGRDTFVLIQGE